MIGVGASANLAAACIGLYLAFVVHSLNLALEVYGSLALGAFSGNNIGKKLVAAEEKEVKNGYDGEKVDGEWKTDNICNKDNSVYNSQPLHLYGDDEEQKNLQIGEKSSKGEEHGKIDIIGGDGVAHSGYKVENEAVYNRQNNACEEIYVESCRAHFAFKGFANEIIEIKENNGP